MITRVMKISVTKIIAGVMFAFFVASPVMAIATPQVQPVSARGCEDRFLGIPPWYRGLTNNKPNSKPADCAIKSPTKENGVTLEQFIWTIVLNVIEMAVVATAYIAAFFILYGGFQFIAGGSNPGSIEKARKTILNAVIGLIISMGSIAIINLIFTSIIPN